MNIRVVRIKVIIKMAESIVVPIDRILQNNLLVVLLVIRQEHKQVYNICWKTRKVVQPFL